MQPFDWNEKLFAILNGDAMSTRDVLKYRS